MILRASMRVEISQILYSDSMANLFGTEKKVSAQNPSNCSELNTKDRNPKGIVSTGDIFFGLMVNVQET